MSAIATNLLGRYILIDDDNAIIDDIETHIANGLAEITMIYRGQGESDEGGEGSSSFYAVLRSATGELHTGIALRGLFVLPLGYLLDVQDAATLPAIELTPHPQPDTWNTGGETSGTVVGRPRSDPSE